MIINSHMVKCGGTTLNHIFMNNFGNNFVQVYPLSGKKDRYGRIMISNEDIDKYLELNKNLKVISGHSIRLFEGQYTALPKSKNIIFLRNPYDRVLSHNNHWKPEELTRKWFETPPPKPALFRLPKFLKYKETKLWAGKRKNINSLSPIAAESNYLVKCIANEENLELAKKILTENFEMVGLVEEFDVSLLMMKQRLNLSNSFDIRYKNVNRGKKYAKFDSIPSHLKDQIKEKNLLDMELYDFAKTTIFQQQINEYKGNLKSDKIEFINSLENFNFSKIKIFLYRYQRYFSYNRKIKQNFNACACSRVIEDGISMCSECESYLSKNIKY